MSVLYYMRLGPPAAWQERRSGVRNWWGGERTDLQQSISAATRQLMKKTASGSAEGRWVFPPQPILSRDDDWPSTWPGDNRPYLDYLLVVFSGDDLDALAKRENMREMYGTYNGEILITDELERTFSYTFKVLYVVGHPGAAENGDLVGDVLYVKVQKGYRNIVAKTKKMLEAVKHVRFKYLLKSDDDTFVCLRRTASQMHLVPPHIKPKVYGGIPTACHLPNQDPTVGKVIKDVDNKWYDGKYLNHTMNGLNCYPVYMQGAFYILSYPLVEFLNEGSSKLLTFGNEDVTIGLWLHGVDRAIFPLNDLRDARLWQCSCKLRTFNPHSDANVFFHACKSVDDLRACKANMPMC